MMNSQRLPDIYSDDNIERENEPVENNETEKPNLAPDKDKDYKVLHKDGSLADLHQGTEDRGAEEGVVGLGT
ncbi:hypothetical protein [Mucilaginibacter segetis]|uniref:Uncharacterized protein n=1 Tax=Mucilaginibacter segetis TaxID=2793071 RepID=A0A934PU31_9SPHI|nr:hypothetical protein [Mucilaginibacter segetis]MBK0380853.1 hypothetical protein [Mucilaginibacter segetis]